MNALTRATGTALLVLAAAGWASAADPTLPPPAARTAAAGASAPAPAAPPPAVPQLQGVRTGPDPSALISGQLLRPGQSWQGYTLLRVEPQAALLRDAQGRTWRLLFTASPAQPEGRP
jgi:hypothetical protein